MVAESASVDARAAEDDNYRVVVVVVVFVVCGFGLTGHFRS